MSPARSQARPISIPWPRRGSGGSVPWGDAGDNCRHGRPSPRQRSDVSAWFQPDPMTGTARMSTTVRGVACDVQGRESWRHGIVGHSKPASSPAIETRTARSRARRNARRISGEGSRPVDHDGDRLVERGPGTRVHRQLRALRDRPAQEVAGGPAGPWRWRAAKSEVWRALDGRQIADAISDATRELLALLRDTFKVPMIVLGHAVEEIGGVLDGVAAANAERRDGPRPSPRDRASPSAVESSSAIEETVTSLWKSG
jgi:hypothetical protein